ncbi:uncharacterized protein F5147DRAFT_658064 [Suillus discolor]|uniref:Uncharacterized protein n=1 Tax=Suillus discolor TaxID=1912936 RepID=A0A9P7JN24_9AGAM|nr:uncharacterized protein F5147DRAFT_658064 [Suillus discolor]KAG2090923.1 hypothetical protein F5147DRAFT_658064 [Suillus discolor]
MSLPDFPKPDDYLRSSHYSITCSPELLTQTVPVSPLSSDDDTPITAPPHSQLAVRSLRKPCQDRKKKRETLIFGTGLSHPICPTPSLLDEDKESSSVFIRAPSEETFRDCNGIDYSTITCRYCSEEGHRQIKCLKYFCCDLRVPIDLALHEETSLYSITSPEFYLWLGRKIKEVCKTCPACEDKKVKCVRLIPEAEDALRDIVAKKKAATTSKAVAKEKKSHSHKPAKSTAPSTSCVPSKRLVGRATRSGARMRIISPTKTDLEGDVKVGQSADVDIDMHAPILEPGSTNVPIPADVEHPLIDISAEGPFDEARNSDLQFPLADFGVEADTPLIDLITPLEPEVPVPSIQRAPMDPPADVPILPFGGDVEDTARPPTSVDAPPAAAHPPPIVLPQVTARDLLLGMEALGRRMDDLQVSNNQAQAWHAQMGKRVSALEQDWEKKFALLEAKVSNLEIKTLNNLMISGNLAGLINSIRPPNNPNPSFAPPAIAGSSTSPYGTLPPSWFPGNPPAPAPTDEPSVSHVGRRYTHAWDESHVSPKTSDPAGPSDLPGTASASPSSTK